MRPPPHPPSKSHFARFFGGEAPYAPGTGAGAFSLGSAGAFAFFSFLSPPVLAISAFMACAGSGRGGDGCVEG
jgi:hypothetical protein